MRNQRGQGKLGLILWLAVLGAGIFAAVRIVPAKVAVMQMRDSTDKEVQSAALASRPDLEKLSKTVLSRADELGIVVEDGEAPAAWSGNDLRLRLKYSVTIDLEVTKWVWNYDETFVHTRY